MLNSIVPVRHTHNVRMRVVLTCSHRQMVRAIMTSRRNAQPSVGKLSRADVDRIPLVLYIPPPPEDHPASPTTPVPYTFSPNLTVPPSTSPPKTTSGQRRCIFFRPSSKRRSLAEDLERGENNGTTPNDPEVDPWDALWEAGPHPFVRLPENLATCGICLMEFEAPRRLSDRGRILDAALDHDDDHNDDNDEGGEAHEMRAIPLSADGIEEMQVEAPRPGDARAVEIAQAGGGDAPDPLRLLSCGHVYHVSDSMLLRILSSR